MSDIRSAHDQALAVNLADLIDAILPQTQCRQCTYPGCRPYAEAIVRGEADINQCPPGGDAGVAALANLLSREPKPLDPAFGPAQELMLVAVVREDECIGCAKCIQACPVDAILGSAKYMHTVIEDECTGCKLCLPPCPVDCIDLVVAKQDLNTWKRGKSNIARERYQSRNERIGHEERERAAKLAATRAALLG